MSRNIGFRGWFYFRQGWSVYFAFIFAAVNTLTVTYFLAIENYPVLKEVFPSFSHYIVIVVAIGIPCLVLIGYAHFKRTASFKAEADITIEANPHLRRILQNTEVLLPSYLALLELVVKLSKNEKLSEDDMNQISNLKNKLDEHIKERKVM
jgi:hypothetical protein|tara:strand:+ start:1169 stop:1621 length:453 start_codon:yes stop_codon:yes gene_type:complete